MRLRILHETRYDYRPAVDHAQHVAHLKPLSNHQQTLLQHRLHLNPAPAHARESLDVYGNTRQFFSFHSAHDQLVVSADSVVQTHPAPALPLDRTRPWEQVRERYRYRKGAPWDAANEFVFESPGIAAHERFAEFARPSFTPGRPVALAAWDLMQRIHRHMRYEALSTEVHTPALQALEQGKGVCQDFAHILVACCRALGLPARYVSGYLLTQPPPGQPRLIGSDASHAWAAVYCPRWPAQADAADATDAADTADTAGVAGGQASEDDGEGFWLELDPTNDRAPGPDYVSLATGRDFLDVSPLRGVIRGGDSHTLSVAVTVMPLENADAGPDADARATPAPTGHSGAP